MNDAMKTLLERAAIDEAVRAWSTYIDTRDWDRLRMLLTDQVSIDYGSNGSVVGDMPAEAWIDRLRVLHGFDATLHMASNLVIRVDGDRATCTSYVNAMHFLTDGGREYHAHACGVYVHGLVRTDGMWKICSAELRLAGRQSGQAAFDEAFARARELAPSRQP